MKKLTIGGATVNQTPLDWSGNIKNITDAIHFAKRESIELLCFPELAISAYGCEDLFLSQWLPAKALSFLPEIASACKGITVAVGLPVNFMGKTYNCVCVIENQKILGITAKQYLAMDGVHYEARWFSPWKPNQIEEINFKNQTIPFGDVTYQIKDITFGFEICEDAWRIDRPGIRLAQKEIDLILSPSASHFAIQKTLERQKLVVESSEKFKCTYLYVNLLGNEAGRMIYDGEIMISRNGHLLAKNKLMSFLPFNVLKHQVDFDTNNYNNQGFEFSAEILSREEEFTRATCLALFDYLRKSGTSGFVLSLSGGADSSACAVLVAEMVKRGIEDLGLEEFLMKVGKLDLLSTIKDGPSERIKQIVGHLLTTAYQATRNSTSETQYAALSLAKSIGARFVQWNIDKGISNATEIIESVIGRDLNWEKDDIALQNIQARVRSPLIWLLANIQNALLLTTSNRSEGDVGYATMDGDTSGSLAPIAAVDKPFIQNWIGWAEKSLGYRALSNVSKLKPSAELRPKEKSQSDEDDLMPYPILLEIEKAAIRDRRSPVEVFHQLYGQDLAEPSHLKHYIRVFFTLWSRNQWKRERIAPSFHLDDFNIDPKTWCRFPIISGGFREELKELDQL